MSCYSKIKMLGLLVSSSAMLVFGQSGECQPRSRFTFQQGSNAPQEIWAFNGPKTGQELMQFESTGVPLEYAIMGHSSILLYQGFSEPDKITLAIIHTPVSAGTGGRMLLRLEVSGLPETSKVYSSNDANEFQKTSSTEALGLWEVNMNAVDSGSIGFPVEGGWRVSITPTEWRQVTGPSQTPPGLKMRLGEGKGNVDLQQLEPIYISNEVSYSAAYFYNIDKEKSARLYPMTGLSYAADLIVKYGKSSIATGFEEAGKSIMLLYQGIEEDNEVALLWLHNKGDGLAKEQVFRLAGTISGLPPSTRILHQDDVKDFNFASSTSNEIAVGDWTYHGLNTDGGSVSIPAKETWRVKIQPTQWSQISGPAHTTPWVLLLGPGKGKAVLDVERAVFIESTFVRVGVDYATVYSIPRDQQYYVSKIEADFDGFELNIPDNHRVPKNSVISLQCCSNTPCTFAITPCHCEPCTRGKDGDLWKSHADFGATAHSCGPSYRYGGTAQNPLVSTMHTLVRHVAPGEIVDLDPLANTATDVAFWIKNGTHLSSYCPRLSGPFPPGSPCTVC